MEEVTNEVAQKSGKGSLRVIAKFVAKQLVRWDVQDENGDTAPISEKILGKIRPGLLVKIYDAMLLCQLNEVEESVKNSE